MASFSFGSPQTAANTTGIGFGASNTAALGGQQPIQSQQPPG